MTMFHPEQPAQSPSKGRRTLLGILALTALVYLPGVVMHEFVSLDDLLLIVQNDKVHGLSPEHLWRAFTSYDPELYVPLTFLTYQMEFTVAGLHPFLYHLDNLLLHLGSIVLVYAIVAKIAKTIFVGQGCPCPTKMDLALFSATLFALHPLNVEAVSWAAARKDVLSGFLALLSFWCFLRFRESDNRRWYHWSVGVFALALLAKVSVILLPLAWIALDALQEPGTMRNRWREYLPFLGLMIVFGVVALFGKTVQIEKLGIAEQTMLGCKALAMTMLRFLLPVGLNPYYPQITAVSLGDPPFVLFVFFVLILLIVSWILRRKTPLLTWGMALFFLAMAPSFMNFWKKGTIYVTSDRYAYLGLIGLSVALGAILAPCIRKIPERARSFGAAIGIIALAGASLLQSQTWKNSIALYEHALAVHPNFAPALNNLGAAVYAAGEQERALTLYTQAIESDPTLTSGYVNLALFRRKQGDVTGAIAMIRSGIAKIPLDRPALQEEITAWSILGSLLDEHGQRDEALAAFAKGVERAPESPDAHYNFAVTLQKYGETRKAEGEFSAYLELRPRDIDARYRLAAMEAEIGMLSEAVKNLNIIIAVDPEYGNAAEHLEKIRKLIGE
jgi:tetratricopeptide (TPR) repeat protein